ncbi:MAG: prolyl-tRNA synthetase associated domain-containing protein [Alphaproteobacteria bacterium]|jgi:Ala-tRNA(Pro) deacylase|nr:prolyl-tRNA synthetase associated domain-containing protein [Alphaproteobacteria bacterium]
MEKQHEIEAPLLARLADLGIEIVLHRHPALHTVEESQDLRGTMPGSHIKNLFLRDKKRNQWLVTVPEDAKVDLKALRHVLGASGNLSFGSAELLESSLGVQPGSVTPFAVMNDADCMVTMVLANDVLTNSPVNAHPLHNEATVAIAREDLVGFLNACKHPPRLIDLP